MSEECIIVLCIKELYLSIKSHVEPIRESLHLNPEKTFLPCFYMVLLNWTVWKDLKKKSSMELSVCSTRDKLSCLDRSVLLSQQKPYRNLKPFSIHRNPGGTWMFLSQHTPQWDQGLRSSCSSALVLTAGQCEG